MTAARFFRINQLTVNGKFEYAALTGDQLHIIDHMLIVTKNIFRRTDGSR
jgi:hypothetical protein